MRHLRAVHDLRRLAHLERWMQRENPLLVAQFRSLRAQRRMLQARWWVGAVRLLLALGCCAAMGVVLAVEVALAAGISASVVTALVLAWYLTRVPVVHERRTSGAPPIHH
ncbi:MAG TPA: DUF3040 domain-containing protein [Frankiaceae bacterium]|jgi:hypothetical protein|nr:DUF3040 domain-containing protein [Frankiaceae bacterium]